MSLLTNNEIISLCTETETPMLSPFVDYKVSTNEYGKKCISYGLGEAGYDLRLHNVFETKHKDDKFGVNYHVIDVKYPNCYTQVERQPDIDYPYGGRGIILAPGETIKGTSTEYFRMPTNVKAICYGKSSYARVDMIPHVTPIEPGWEGYLTIEVVNLANYHNVLYLDEGIVQVIFFWLGTPVQYKGTYQGQSEQRPYKALEEF